MIILKANGFEMTDEQSMQRAIANSAGQLQLLVRTEAEADPQVVNVAMQIVSSVSY
jgi:hypothetical protein